MIDQIVFQSMIHHVGGINIENILTYGTPYPAIHAFD